MDFTGNNSHQVQFSAKLELVDVDQILKYSLALINILMGIQNFNHIHYNFWLGSPSGLIQTIKSIENQGIVDTIYDRYENQSSNLKVLGTHDSYFMKILVSTRYLLNKVMLLFSVGGQAYSSYTILGANQQNSNVVLEIWSWMKYLLYTYAGVTVLMWFTSIATAPSTMNFFMYVLVSFVGFFFQNQQFNTLFGEALPFYLNYRYISRL
ncbi:UNKNOWN [Stylonychia lemnae]|uniref:Uncharacterized protein n=1 Tax=Stylonychia lemnae TaxID=5949 RepID=A0A078B9G1_STYLE|nr:UNKNOWN [Stylonychia lemnae]|eukprot:CDW90208.1 UNKNOWN [Stylonychia lemnae]